MISTRKSCYRSNLLAEQGKLLWAEFQSCEKAKMEIIASPRYFSNLRSTFIYDTQENNCSDNCVSLSLYLFQLDVKSS